MIQTSELYKQLFNSGAIQEYKVVIDGVEYLGDSIYDTPTITQNLFDKPTLTVGSFTIAELNIKLKVPSSDINSNSSIEFYYRYTNGDENSEWIKKFNGYINSREQVDNEVTTVQAKSKAYNYDLFLDHIEVDAYPANARVVAQKCATHLGLTLDADVINENIVEFPNELTVVQVLQLIGKSSGGNWYITPDDKLQLIKQKRRNLIKSDFSDFTAYAGATVTRNKTFPIDVFKGGRNLILNSGVTKQFTEQVTKPQINSEFELEQVLTLECYFGIKLGDLM